MDDEIRAERQPQFGDALDPAAGFLDADDVGVRGGKPGSRGRRDLDAGASRHAVEHDRQLDRVGYGREMVEQPVLRRLVVVGRHQQEAFRTRGFGPFGLGDGEPRRVRAGAGHDEGAPGGGLDGGSDHRLGFVVAQRRGLAGGADRHEPGDAGCDLCLDQLLERGDVDSPAAEGGDQGGEHARQAPAQCGIGHRIGSLRRQSMTTLVSLISRRVMWMPSRPSPLDLMPPNGTFSARKSGPSLIITPPTRSRRPTRLTNA